MTEEKVLDEVEKTVPNKKTKPKVADKSNQQLIYFGPTLKNLQQYQIFKGELPDHVKKHIETMPILKSLFIEPKELPLVQRNLVIKGSREYLLYELAASKTKGGIVNEEV
ncbi:hypothetical protein [Psychrobacillus sp.]|uniref:hypothetical protein n=1 Tax=Psychrobacillus sp. TaxID=1871623 RepID=UPI0028BD6E82|nr:hypothetical protein [Psychrobacillus sp.]